MAAINDIPINSNLFSNKTFLLTLANRTTDFVYDRAEMKRQILERGGTIVNDIEQVPLTAEAYLIADNYYRTHKYLHAMARGMPCLSYRWVNECVARDTLVPRHSYKLPAGMSLLNGEMYPLPDVRGKLLKGRSIMVYSTTKVSHKPGAVGFKSIWAPIVELLGGTVVSDECLTECKSIDQLMIPHDFDILLTDTSCPPEVVQKVENAGKTVVSSEWLIQSIIMAECLHFKAHSRFLYDSGLSVSNIKQEVKNELNEDEEQKSEINSRLFEKKWFTLTSAKRAVRAFNSHEMKKRIIERSGIIVENIEQIPPNAEAYLITDTYYRTHKYLYAMSRNMPCLSFTWVEACVAGEKLVPYHHHKLWAGMSLLNGEMYPLPDVRGKLLKGRSVMVHSQNMEFKQIWSPIVDLLGGSVVSDECLEDCSTPEEIEQLALPDDFDILLTNPSCLPEMVQTLENAGKIVVGSEWLIQSIIMGECPDSKAHSRFRYDDGIERALP